ncbi:hypothetical protein Tco_0105642 [Tanacetum coccineum]
MIRAAAPSTYILAPRSRILPSETPLSGTPPLLLIPLPTPLPPFILYSTDCRAGVSEVTLPPRKRLYIALGLRFKVGESSSAPTTRPTRGFRVDYGFVGTLDDEIRRDPKREVSYGITDTWDGIVEDMHGTPAMTDVAGLSQRMTDSRLLDMIVTRFIGDWTMHRMTEMVPKRTTRSTLATTTTTTTTVTDAQLKALIYQGVANALATRDADRSRNGKDSHDSGSFNGGRLLVSRAKVIENQALIAQGVADVLAERDATRNRNGEDRHDSGTGVRRAKQAAREYTYPDFMKCQPLNFKGTEGVVELTQWTVGHDVAYEITWKKPDKHDDGKELALMCVRMFPEESDKIEKYVGGLPDMIHGSMMASKPKTMQDAIEFATELIDKKINTFAECQAENKRKFDDTSRNNPLSKLKQSSQNRKNVDSS